MRRWTAHRAAVVVLAVGLGVACGSNTDPETAERPVSGDCPPPLTQSDNSTHIDWIDFVKLDGREYHRLGSVYPTYGGEQTLRRSALGQPVARVCQELSGLRPPADYQTQDGDAAFLPAGTLLHRVDGYAPWFRVGAIVHGQVLIYELFSHPEAKTGADVLDIRGRVRAIAVRPGYHGEPAGTSEAGDIRPIVDALLAAPTVESQRSGRDVYIVFRLTDGTTVVRPYSPRHSILWPQLKTPQKFDALVAELV